MSKLTRATVPMCPECGAPQTLTCDDYYVHQCTECGWEDSSAQMHWGYYDNAKEVVREMREFYDAEEVIDLDIVASWMDRLGPGKDGEG